MQSSASTPLCSSLRGSRPRPGATPRSRTRGGIRVPSPPGRGAGQRGPRGGAGTTFRVTEAIPRVENRKELQVINKANQNQKWCMNLRHPERGPNLFLAGEWDLDLDRDLEESESDSELLDIGL